MLQRIVGGGAANLSGSANEKGRWQKMWVTLRGFWLAVYANDDARAPTHIIASVSVPPLKILDLREMVLT